MSKNRSVNNMGKNTKIIAAAAAVLMVLGAAGQLPDTYRAAGGSITASAEDTASGKDTASAEEKTNDEYSYLVQTRYNTDGTTENVIYLNKYLGSDKDVVIPEKIDGLTVVSILFGAFSGCDTVKSVKIPAGVTFVSSDSFQGNDTIESITVDEGNERFCSKDGALFTKNMKKLIYCPTTRKSFTIPKETVAMTMAPFGDSHNLQNIYVEKGNNYFSSTDGVLYYKDGTALRYFPKGKKELNIPKSCTTVEAFRLTGSDLETITVEKGNKYVSVKGNVLYTDGGKTATFCIQSTSGAVKLAAGTERIGRKAFFECRDLTGITVPEGVTDIDEYAFYECRSLSDISLPDSLEHIGSTAFLDAYPYFYGYAPDDTKEVGCRFADGWVIRGSDYVAEPDLSGIRGIADGAFAYSGVTKVAIPSSVKKIGSSTFRGCRQLKSVTLPEGLTEIGEDAFNGCSQLKSITLPKGLTEIGEWAFNGCDALESINIPSTVKEIGRVAFQDCTSMTEAVLSKGLEKINDYTFAGCTALKTVKLPKTLNEIGYCAFENCTSLKEITIPEGVEELPWYVFSGCTALEKVSLPDSLKKISYRVFDGTKLLEDQDTALKYADGWLVEGDGTAESIVLPEKGIGLRGMERSVFSSSKLKTLTVGKEVGRISEEAFKNSEQLEKVTLAEGLTEIGDNAFFNCTKLKSITIPASVEKIGEYAIGYIFDETATSSAADIDSSVWDEDTENVNPATGAAGWPKAVDKDFTIYCYEGTAGHRYAIDNGISFKLVSDTVAGDCNGDGKTTMKDYSDLQKYLSGWDVSIDVKAADINGDGKVTMKDYAALQRKLNGWKD